MTDPRIVRGHLVYPMKLRRISSGFAITIPMDAIRSLGWLEGDSMALELLEDGLVVSKVQPDADDEIERRRWRA